MATQMLYKYPSKNTFCDGNIGFTEIDGIKYDYLIVEEGEEVSGYYPSIGQIDAKRPPSRAELETKANALGISFRSDITDATLLKKIEDKLAG